MKFKEKFGYMFIGCLFTLAGYFFASLGGGPSLPNAAHAQHNEEVIEKLVCKEITIVNKDGEKALRIGTKQTTLNIVNEDSERLSVRTGEFSGGIDIYNGDGKVVASIGANATMAVL